MWNELKKEAQLGQDLLAHIGKLTSEMNMVYNKWKVLLKAIEQSPDHTTKQNEINQVQQIINSLSQAVSVGSGGQK